jgi:hypothetical protein
MATDIPLAGRLDGSNDARKDVKTSQAAGATDDTCYVEELEKGNGKIVERMDYSGAQEKTDPAEIKLVRKLDRMIMPILWAMYFLNYLDRNALPQARLNTLEQDLNLKGVEYNTAISILFVGYILMQSKSR